MMFEWPKLLSKARLSHQHNDADNTDNAFESDYKRIVTSPAFRRLQDKTQVFPLERNDFVHTRLTHSIEVAMIARELANSICTPKNEQYGVAREMIENRESICQIVENASLLHDIGNPPFGHFGEYIISNWFKENLRHILKKDNIQLDEKYISDLENFEGNAQALRITTSLHDFSGNYGMDLTCATLNSIMKYTASSLNKKKSENLTHKKIGYFLSEEDIFEKITNTTETKTARHPLAFILEAADDIAYLTADIEDAIKKEIVTFKELKEYLSEYLSQSELEGELKNHLSDLLKKDLTNQNLFFLEARSKLVYAAKFSFTKHYKEIMQGSYQVDLFYNSHASALHSALKSFSIKKIFSNKDILKLEISGHSILTFLLDRFIPAVIDLDDDFNCKNKLNAKLVSLISESHKEVCRKCCKGRSKDEKLYRKMLMVTDFISGMTDSYAHDLYLVLSGKNIN